MKLPLIISIVFMIAGIGSHIQQSRIAKTPIKTTIGSGKLVLYSIKNENIDEGVELDELLEEAGYIAPGTASRRRYKAASMKRSHFFYEISKWFCWILMIGCLLLPLFCKKKKENLTEHK